MQMGYDFENSLLAAEAGAGARARFGADAAGLPQGGPGTGVAAAPGAHEAGEPAALRQPDWAGLRARFTAIHALRQALAADSAGSVAAGSFTGAGESVLSACTKGPAVNPLYWVNCKAPCGITGSVAAAPHAATED